MTGQTISHFRVIEKIGGGGMGVVYLAENLKLGSKVALKFLPPHMATDTEAKQRFVQEARAASSLNHANICTIHDIDETEDGQLFIAMSHYEGETLKAKLERGPLPIADAVEIVRQIAEGLAAAHEKGIVHRDIKPANIFVTKRGRAVILDFGLAKLSGSIDLTRSGSTLGTASYMSPEQFRGEDVGPAADMWSLGVILYEMLAGERPFSGDYEQAVMYAVLNAPLADVKRLRPETPTSLQKIVKLCLDRDAVNRGSAKKVIDLLAVDGSGFQLSTSSSTNGGSRIRLVSVLAVAILLLAGAALVWLTRGIEGDTEIDSIIVLPLRNLSGDAQQEYFADGITEELIDKLGRLESLRVISSTTSMRYKQSDLPLPDIADELDVNGVVEGSIQLSGKDVRVRVRLIDDRDRQLWNGSFERPMRDILALQDEIAMTIAREISLEITPDEKARLARGVTVDPAAFDLYLKAKALLGRRDPSAMIEARRLLESAIDIEPEFAPAYARLAEASFSGLWTQEVQPPRVEVEALLQRAMELDPELSETFVSRGLIRQFWDLDMAGAEEDLRTAIRLNPNLADAHHELAQLLMRLRRFEEAIDQSLIAVQLNPGSAWILSGLGEIYSFSGRHDRAISVLHRALELDPERVSTRGWLFTAYYFAGRLEEAIPYADMKTVWFEPPSDEVILADSVEARRLLSQVSAAWDESTADAGVLAWGIAKSYAYLNDVDRAFEWLYRYSNIAAGFNTYVGVDPLFETVRSDPRYHDYLYHIGLDELVR
ncbi:MAG: protein kinase [Rhodothermia bacterium]|nr:protein kinase [Rhodothermia bacterium]